MKLTYTAYVDHDWYADQTIVRVRGQRYTEPLEGVSEPELKASARRAVRHLFNVDGMHLSVEWPDRIHHPHRFIVTATA